MKIGIIHTEWWNGGAERLILSIGQAFLTAGHEVTFVGGYEDPYWTKMDSFGLVGAKKQMVWMPALRGDFYTAGVTVSLAILANELLRCFKTGDRFNPNIYDIILTDFSASLAPLWKLIAPEVKIMYYCHYPQQLFMTPEQAPGHKFPAIPELYGDAVGVMEKFLFDHCDVYFSNSVNTRYQMSKCMPNLRKQREKVLLPTAAIPISNLSQETKKKNPHCKATPNQPLLLSINRFWYSKRVDLIVEAAYLNAKHNSANNNAVFILAGGIEPRFTESRNFYNILKFLSNRNGSQSDLARPEHQNSAYCSPRSRSDYEIHKTERKPKIIFKISPNERRKRRMLLRCTTVVYSSPHEHFGIVPIEAMHFGKPVIGNNTDGPAETIVDGITGYRIRHIDPLSMSTAIAKSLSEDGLLQYPTDSESYQKELRDHAEKFEMKTFDRILITSLKGLEMQ